MTDLLIRQSSYGADRRLLRRLYLLSHRLDGFQRRLHRNVEELERRGRLSRSYCFFRCWRDASDLYLDYLTGW